MRWTPILVLILAAALPCAAQGQGRFEIRKEPVSESRARLLSVLYPGLGQLVAGHREKGTALVAGATASLVVWLTSHADYNTHVEQFDLETARYLALRDDGSFDEAQDSWEKLRQRQDDLDRSHNLRVAFGAITLGLYAYNLVDVFALGGARAADEDHRVTLSPRPLGDGLGVSLTARFD